MCVSSTATEIAFLKERRFSMARVASLRYGSTTTAMGAPTGCSSIRQAGSFELPADNDIIPDMNGCRESGTRSAS